VNLRVVVRPEAALDLDEAYTWYEGKLSGLGDDFLNSVDATIAAIQRNPEAYPVVHRNVRRALLRRFPYGVFYVQDSEQVLVVAVFHARRDPRSWQGRS
jgi:plasmid stabilization system protein ParE